MSDEFEPNPEVLSRVRKHLHGHEEPALTTKEIANHFDFSIDYTTQLLFHMEVNGVVGTKKIGDELLWWPTAVPKLDDNARGILLDPNYSFPLSIREIHEIVSEFVPSDESDSPGVCLEIDDHPSGSLRVAFQHLEKAEERIRKAGDRLNLELNIPDEEVAEDSELRRGFRSIKSARQKIGKELINRGEELRR